MKQMIKYIAVLFAALSLLLLVGCSTPDADLEQGGGLRISINDNIGRSILPSVNFTKYTLSFENTNGSATYNDIELDLHSKFVTINDLPNGNWKITATGYVKIGDNEYPAATGDKEITVTAGNFQTVSITISAKHTGDNGFLSYDIGYPNSVIDAQLYIFDIGSDYNAHHGVTVKDLKTKKNDTISHAPGFYMMSVRMETEYRTVAWTEVIHIYSNMETVAKRVFTEDDLTRLVTAGGKANITINGMPASNAYVMLYSNSDYTGIFYPALISEGKWSLAMPALAQLTTLYVRVELSFAGNNYKFELDNITLHEGHTAYGDITHNFTDDFITVSGAANFTINGAVPSDRVDVRVEKWNEGSQDWDYPDLNSSIIIDNSTYTLLLNKELLNERIRILLWNNFVIDEFDLDSTSITQNITFHATNKVILKGDIDFKVNGEYPSELLIFVKDHLGNDKAYGNFSPQSTWEIELETLSYYSQDVFIWVWTPESGDYNTGLYKSIVAKVFDDPTEAIEITEDIEIDVPLSTQGGIITVFDTNNAMWINLFDYEVNIGTELGLEICNNTNYTHEPVIDYTWFINGVLQSVNTVDTSDQYVKNKGTVYLPTTDLSPGKQYALVVVTIDGIAFAQEFDFLVVE